MLNSKHKHQPLLSFFLEYQSEINSKKNSNKPQDNGLNNKKKQLRKINIARLFFSLQFVLFASAVAVVSWVSGV